MLDQETKKKINGLRDTLVGKVPDPKSQVEQIMIALIYKFMNDMDKESTDLGGEASFFVGDFEKYSWDNLFGTKVSGSELVDLYSTAVESMEDNPNIPQLFRDIFKNAYIPYKDAETLRLFLSQIDDFEYSKDSEQLGDAFEHILNSLSSQGDAGQFRTPRHIIDFIVEIIDPKKDETVLDPASGTSGFLISAFKHIVQSNSEKSSGDLLSAAERKKIMKNINGYDISPDMVRIGLANMYLHGFPEPNVVEYDALTSEDRWSEYYDVILANPPFMTPKGGIRPHNKFGLKSNRAEVLFVDYILTHLKPKGRAGIIVPEGIIFQSGKAYKELRKKLVENGLTGVISLPAGVFNPYSGVKTSILIIDKLKKSDQVFYLEVHNDGYSLTTNRTQISESDLPNILNQIKSQKIKKENYIAIDEINEDNNYKLTKTKEIYVDSDYQLVPITDVAFFQEGPGILSKEYRENGYPIINVKCVQDGYLKLDDTKFVGEEIANGKWNHFKVEKDDILFTTSGTIGRVSKVSSEDLPLLMNTSVVRFRTLDENKLKNNFLYTVLRSQKFKEELLSFQTGSAQKNVGPTHIKKIKIPLPPLEKQQEIVDEIEQYQKVIDGARQVIENYKPKINISSEMQFVKLKEVFKTSSGGTPLKSKAEYYENGDIPWLRSGEVKQGFISKTELFITKKGLENSSAKLFPINTVVVAMYGATAGQSGILKIESSTNQAVCGILPNQNYDSEFLYFYLLSKESYLLNLGQGGAQPNISQNIIKELEIPHISLDQQVQIVNDIKKDLQNISNLENLIEKSKNSINDLISNLYN